MAERGATPKVPAWRRTALRAVRAFFTPLLPDDYLELINPLWSTQELRGRIERIERETADAVTVVIKPGWEWPGHEPGQYLRIGFVGRRHAPLARVLAHLGPGRPDGFISITPKLVESGAVTPYLVREAQPGTIVRLGGVEGTFVLPDPLPERLLFVSAGSGITPIMSMLRSLDRDGALRDVVHLHSARTADDIIFGGQLRALDERHDGYRLHEQLTGEQGRLAPADLDELCPDWRERETFVCGPAEHARRADRALGAGGRRPATACTWSASSRSSARATASTATAARSASSRSDVEAAVGRRHADPRRRRGGRRDAPLRLPDGHLPHLRRPALLRPDPRPADRRGVTAARARWSAPASTRPRAQSRSHC